MANTKLYDNINVHSCMEVLGDPDSLVACDLFTYRNICLKFRGVLMISQDSFYLVGQRVMKT